MKIKKTKLLGGLLSNSLAIATDAAHLLTDFASFMISLFAIWIGGRPSTKKYVIYFCADICVPIKVE